MKQKYKAKTSSGVSKETQAIFQEDMEVYVKKENDLQVFENLSVKSDLKIGKEEHSGNTDSSVYIVSIDLSHFKTQSKGDMTNHRFWPWILKPNKVQFIISCRAKFSCFALWDLEFGHQLF